MMRHQRGFLAVVGKTVQQHPGIDVTRAGGLMGLYILVLHGQQQEVSMLVGEAKGQEGYPFFKTEIGNEKC